MDAGLAAVGMDAPLHFTLKDMNGVDVKLASFKGKVILHQLLGDLVRPVQRRDSVSHRAAERSTATISSCSASRAGRSVEKLKPFADDMKVNYPLLVGNRRKDVQDAFGPLWGIPDDGDRRARRQGCTRSIRASRPKEQFEQDDQVAAVV